MRRSQTQRRTRHRQASRGIARARRDLAAQPAEMHAKRGSQARIIRILHGDFNKAPAPGAFAVKQSGQCSGVKMRTAQKIHHRRAGFHRRAIRKTRGVHNARCCLHGQVHRQLVAIRPGTAIAGCRRIDQARIALDQRFLPKAKLIHRPRREILNQDIGAIHHGKEQLAPRFILEVNRNA
jgi:hypothetical protein